jgi:hypothetical protein
VGAPTVWVKWLLFFVAIMALMFLLRRYGRPVRDTRYAWVSNALLCALWAAVSIHSFNESNGAVFGWLFGVLAIWYGFEVARNVFRRVHRP